MHSFSYRTGKSDTVVKENRREDSSKQCGGCAAPYQQEHKIFTTSRHIFIFFSNWILRLSHFSFAFGKQYGHSFHIFHRELTIKSPDMTMQRKEKHWEKWEKTAKIPTKIN